VYALARQLGDAGMHRVLEEAERLAPQLDAEDALPTVRALVVAALGSADAQLESPRLAARADGVAFDPRRVEMFEQLTDALEGIAPSSRPADPTDSRWHELAFFEAHFSNSIEGTEFTIPEARTIVVGGIDPPGRPADAHDVRGTFEIVASLDEMRETPKTPEQLDVLLRRRHAALMSARPEKQPGEYKQTPNRAGAYTFVDPAVLTGTMARGFELLQRLVHPFHRAVSMMFLIAECHPFLDGNGRIARVMANAELVAGGESRIVIPSVYRNNYLAGLRAISNGTNTGESLFSILDFARRWVSYVDWSTFDRAMSDLQRTNALEDPGVADREGRRLLVP
jgi:Fic family protein